VYTGTGTGVRLGAIVATVESLGPCGRGVLRRIRLAGPDMRALRTSSHSVVSLYGIGILGALGLSAAVRARASASAGSLPYGILLDDWSCSFAGLLGLVSSAVLLWRFYYMDHEPSYRRFLGILVSFVASMVMLIFFATLFSSLIG